MYDVYGLQSTKATDCLQFGKGIWVLAWGKWGDFGAQYLGSKNVQT